MSGSKAKVSKKYDIRPIKKRFVEYRNNELELDNQVERIDYLETKLYSVGSPEMTDMPKSPNVVTDRKTLKIAQRDELKEETRRLVEHQVQERMWIDSVMQYIKRPNDRAVIRMRYIDLASWSQICRMIFGKREDFEDKYQSYMRNLTNMHIRALENIASRIEHIA